MCAWGVSFWGGSPTPKTVLVYFLNTRGVQSQPHQVWTNFMRSARLLCVKPPSLSRLNRMQRRRSGGRVPRHDLQLHVLRGDV